jgi:peptide/nickel transport system substrate-binding protein
MTKRVLASTAALAAVLLLQPAAVQAQNTPVRGGTLTVAGTSDLQQLNSLVAADGPTLEVVNNVLFLSLLKLNAQLQPAASLARTWTMAGDTSVTFRLRRDVRWHDGKPTTAHDVAFTINRAKDTLTAFPAASAIAHWKSAIVVDSYTVRVRLSPLREPLHSFASLAIMPKHVLDSIPPQRLREAAFNKAPVGNGPFRFVSQRANDRWVFEANPAFPRELGGRPYVDRLVWRIIPEAAVQLVELRTGNVDVILAIRADQINELDARPDLRAIVKPSKRFTMIVWNSKRAPLDQVNVRRALTMGMNRQQMLTLLRAGRGRVAISPIPPSHWAFDSQLAPLPYDTVQARRLLAQAGYRDRNGDGVVESADGKPFEIELTVAANNQFNRDLAEMARSDLAKIGVKVVPRPLDYATLVENLSSEERKFDGTFLIFETDLQLNLTDAFHTKSLGGPFQSASYSNPRLDRLLDQAMTAKTIAEARTAWSGVQRILRDEQPWTFLWYHPELFVVNERVRNINMDLRGFFQDLPKWWIAGNQRR